MSEVKTKWALDKSFAIIGVLVFALSSIVYIHLNMRFSEKEHEIQRLNDDLEKIEKRIDTNDHQIKGIDKRLIEIHTILKFMANGSYEKYKRKAR